MIPEIETVSDNVGHLSYRYVCPRCGKRGNQEASTSAAIYLLSIHMEGRHLA